MIPGSLASPGEGGPWDVLQADACLQFAVWRDLVLASWRAGEIPFWNPYQLAGTPLLANSQSGALYPPHVLAGLIGMPTPVALVLLAWLHLAWSGLGAWRLAERLGAEASGALFAGTTFALSSFMIGWTALPSVISTSAWIPWMILAAYRVASDPRWTAGAANLAACASMAVLAGHLQFAFYGVLGSLCVGLVAGWRRAPALLIGLGLGAMLAGPQLAPVLAAAQDSHRRGQATAQGYAAYVAPTRSIGPIAWLGQAALPSARGLPSEPLPGLAGANGYWPSVVVRGANFAEDAVGIGPLAVGLLALLRRRDLQSDRGLGLAIAGLVALLLAVGAPLNAALYFGVPGWSSTGSPGRALVLFVLAAAVLSGLAVRETDRRRAMFAVGAIVIGLVAATVAAIPPGASDFGISSEQVRALADETLRAHLPALLLATAAAAAGIATLAAPAARRWRGWAIVGLATALPALLYAGRAVPFGPWPDLSAIPRPPAGTRVAIENEAWELLVAAPALLPPNLASLARTPELSGYDSLLHRQTKALLDRVNGRDSAPPANGNMLLVKPGASRDELRAAGVGELWRRAPTGLERVAIGGSVVEGPVTIERRALSGITLRASGAGRALVRERFLPGWSASVAGRPMPIDAQGPWMRIDVPGPGEVRLRYVPPGFASGAAMAAFALLVIVAILFFGRRDTGGGVETV